MLKQTTIAMMAMAVLLVIDVYMITVSEFMNIDDSFSAPIHCTLYRLYFAFILWYDF